MTQPNDNWQKRPVPTLSAKHVIADTHLQQSEPTVSCSECHSQSSITVWTLNQFVCPNCDHHMHYPAEERLSALLDDVELVFAEEYVSGDPLQFVDSKPYIVRLQEAKKKAKTSEALIVRVGCIDHLRLVVACFEFDFLGGSMGSAVGDRFVAACEYALIHKLPLVCFAASGGARMQEGLLSLMQMARTSAAIERLKMHKLPYIVVLTNPCYGGVTASLAMLGDIHIAEPKAMVGFAGKRVIEGTVRQKLSDQFQRAEFLEEHGMVDMIVHRHELKVTLHRLLAKLMT